jgi:uncharacterized phage protein gp47/JayE
MPLRTLSIKTLEDSGLARLSEREPSINVNVYGNHIQNLVKSIAYGIFPATSLVGDVYKDAFPQTAEGDVLDANFGAMEGLLRKPASKSTGKIAVFDSIGTNIPVFTKYNTSDGIEVETTASSTVAMQITTISSVVNNDGFVTFTASVVPHTIPKGASVTISISNPLVDGVREILGVSDSTFSIEIDSIVPISGTGAATANYAVIQAQTVSDGAGSQVGGSIELQGDNEAYTLFSGLSGGAGKESDTSYKARIIKTRGALEGVFTQPQIILAALSVPGNTRAWVVSPKTLVAGGTPGVAGYKPQPGEVCVYFLRDNDVSPIPDAVEIATTKDAIIQKGRMPANTLDSDIFVFSPTLVTALIQIDNLSPNTPEMRAAIEGEMRAYFEDFVDFETAVSTEDLISVVKSTRDPANRAVSTFNVVNTDQNPGSGGLLVYGAIQWL